MDIAQSHNSCFKLFAALQCLLAEFTAEEPSMNRFYCIEKTIKQAVFSLLPKNTTTQLQKENRFF